MQLRARAGALLIGMVVGAFAPCDAGAQEDVAPVALPIEIDRVLRDYEAAWQASDPARLARLFHPQGFVLSSGRPPVRGRSAIEQHYARAGGELHLWAIDYVVSDTAGYIVGFYRGAAPGPEGKFVLALRRDRADAPWLIGADMDNRNSR